MAHWKCETEMHKLVGQQTRISTRARCMISLKYAHYKWARNCSLSIAHFRTRMLEVNTSRVAPLERSEEEREGPKASRFGLYSPIACDLDMGDAHLTGDSCLQAAPLCTPPCVVHYTACTASTHRPKPKRRAALPPISMPSAASSRPSARQKVGTATACSYVCATDVTDCPPVVQNGKSEPQSSRSAP
eukprot:scaffold42115_cov31-Tisochrysis_lutea.AAC.1